MFNIILSLVIIRYDLTSLSVETVSFLSLRAASIARYRSRSCCFSSDIAWRIIIRYFRTFASDKCNNNITKIMLLSKVNTTTVTRKLTDGTYCVRFAFTYLGFGKSCATARCNFTFKILMLDYVSTGIVKFCSTVFSELIAHLANLSFSQGFCLRTRRLSTTVR